MDQFSSAIDGNLRIGLRWKILNCVENNQPNEKHIASLDFMNEMLNPDLVAVIVSCYCRK